jgi:menaquinone-dependent protoporphyrinogen oxidase
MRALIVYGSKRGGTAGLAHMIGTAFEGEGWHAAVCDAAKRPGVGDVDVVVIGGALYMNRWPSALRRWTRQHLPTLKTVPVWMFSSGPLDDSARAGDIAPVPQVGRLAAQIEIHGHMTFGGRLEAHPGGFIAGQMAKKSAGDWRNPQHVAEWVHQICRDMTLPAAIPVQRATEQLRVESSPDVERSRTAPRS